MCDLKRPDWKKCVVDLVNYKNKTSENIVVSRDNFFLFHTVRPSLKNCMFAVLLPIIFEVGR